MRATAKVRIVLELEGVFEGESEDLIKYDAIQETMKLGERVDSTVELTEITD